MVLGKTVVSNLHAIFNHFILEKQSVQLNSIPPRSILANGLYNHSNLNLGLKKCILIGPISCILDPVSCQAMNKYFSQD